MTRERAASNDPVGQGASACGGHSKELAAVSLDQLHHDKDGGVDSNDHAQDNYCGEQKFIVAHVYLLRHLGKLIEVTDQVISLQLFVVEGHPQLSQPRPTRGGG